MEYKTQQFSFISAGSRTVITNATVLPKCIRVTFAGENSNDQSCFSIGTWDGTRQNARASYASGGTNGVIADLRTTAGAVVESASVTSVAIVSGFVRVTFNVTQTSSTTGTLELLG